MNQKNIRESGAPQIEDNSAADLHPQAGNPRVHTPKHVGQIADSIRRFGFTNPILIDENKNVLAGHGRLAAAKLLGMTSVPTLCLAHLSKAQRRAYVIADNKLGDLSRFDRKLLAAQVELVLEADATFDVEVMGFETDECELLLDGAGQETAQEPAAPPPERQRPANTRLGDLWTLGRHKLYCGNALERDSYLNLMGRERARTIFADVPYNIAAKTISGGGKIRHGDFAMASSEMSETEFIAFLTTGLTYMSRFSVHGAIHYICIDWRHLFELITAGRAVFDRQLDLCVWAKAQPAMGSPYRQQHELIAVFKRGTRPHVENIELGRNGRNRSNLWSYSSGPNFSAKRQEELSWHPTVKPLAMVQDALLDSSHRDDLVLDGFGGSGTTLIAAEQSDRQARLIELDPYYCDVTIRRFEGLTGCKAIAADGDSFAARAQPRNDLASEEVSHD